MSRFGNFIISLLIIPLYIFKQIGELIIETIIYIISAIFSTYKLFILSFYEFLKLPYRLLRFLIVKSRRKKRNKLRKKLSLAVIKTKYFLLGIFFLGMIISFQQLHSFVINLPNPRQINLAGFPVTSKIYDRDGILLYEIYERFNRTPIKLNQVPKYVIEATIATEDEEFYLHNGISLRGISRALIHNLSSDSLEGGSTLTQQLIRSTYLTPEKTYLRKFKEIILAIWIEKFYTKDQKKYKKRQEMVLKRMLGEGLISKKEYDEAFSTEIKFKEPRTPIAAPHF